MKFLRARMLDVQSPTAESSTRRTAWRPPSMRNTARIVGILAVPRAGASTVSAASSQAAKDATGVS